MTELQITDVVSLQDRQNDTNSPTVVPCDSTSDIGNECINDGKQDLDDDVDILVTQSSKSLKCTENDASCPVENSNLKDGLGACIIKIDSDDDEQQPVPSFDSRNGDELISNKSVGFISSVGSSNVIDLDELETCFGSNTNKSVANVREQHSNIVILPNGAEGFSDDGNLEISSSEMSTDIDSNERRIRDVYNRDMNCSDGYEQQDNGTISVVKEEINGPQGCSIIQTIVVSTDNEPLLNTIEKGEMNQENNATVSSSDCSNALDIHNRTTQSENHHKQSTTSIQSRETGYCNDRNTNILTDKDEPQCVICKRTVLQSHSTLQCDQCEGIVHIKCDGIAYPFYSQYKSSSSSSLLYSCPSCRGQGGVQIFANESTTTGEYDSLDLGQIAVKEEAYNSNISEGMMTETRYISSESDQSNNIQVADHPRENEDGDIGTDVYGSSASPSIPFQRDISNHYLCPFCDYKSLVSTNIKYHLVKKHHLEGPSVYKCKVCNKKEIHASSFINHCNSPGHKHMVQLSGNTGVNPLEYLFIPECLQRDRILQELCGQSLQENRSLTESNSSAQLGYVVGKDKGPKSQLMPKYISKGGDKSASNSQVTHDIRNSSGHMLHKQPLILPHDTFEKSSLKADADGCYSCHLCTYKSISRHCLESHLVQKHGQNTPRAYACTICGLKTLSSSNFVKHCQSYHHNQNILKLGKERIDPKEFIVLPKKTSSSSREMRLRSQLLIYPFVYDSIGSSSTKVRKLILHCKFCSYQTNIKQALIKHMSAKHNFKNKKHVISLKESLKPSPSTSNFHADKNKKSQDLTPPTSENDGNGPRILTKEFVDEAKGADGRIYCKLCSYQTNFTTNFRNHLVVRHNFDGPGVYRCKLCNLKTVLRRNMIEHFNTTLHKVQRAKIYGMDEDGTTCKGEANIDQRSGKFDKQVHSQGAKMSKLHDSKQTPFSNNIFHCNQCFYKASSESNLRKHYMSSHKFDSDGWFKCKLCQFSTLQMEVFMSHYNSTKHKDAIKDARTGDVSPLEHSVFPLNMRRDNPAVELNKQLANKSTFSTTCDQYDSEKNISIGEAICNIESDSFMPALSKGQVGPLKMGNANLSGKAVKSSTMKPSSSAMSKKRAICETNLLITKHSRFVNDLYNCNLCLYKTNEKRSMRIHLLQNHNMCSAKAYRCQLCEKTTVTRMAFISHCRSLGHLLKVNQQGKYASDPLEYLTFPASMSKTSIGAILERTQKDPVGLGSAQNQILATADMENSRAAFNVNIETTAMMGSPKKEVDSSMRMGIDRTAAKVPNSKRKSDSSTVVNKINKTARRSASETSKMIHKHARFINNLYYCNLCFYKTNMKGNMRVHLLGKHHMYSAKAYRCQLCKKTAVSRKAFIGHCRSLGHLLKVNKQGKYASDPLEYLIFPASMSKTSVAAILERTQKDPDGLGSAQNQIFTTAMVGSPNKGEDSLMGMGIDRTAAKEPSSNLKSDGSTIGKKIHRKARQSACETNKMIRKHARFVNNLYCCNLCIYKTNMKGNMRIHLLLKHNIYSATAYRCQLCEINAVGRKHFILHCSSLAHHHNVKQQGKYTSDPLEYLTFPASMSSTSINAILERIRTDLHGLGRAQHQILATADMENSRAAFDGNIETTAMMGSPNKGEDSSMRMGIDRTSVKMPNSKLKSDGSTVVKKMNRTARQSTCETNKMIHKHARFVNNLYCCNLCFYKSNLKGNMKNHLLLKHHMYSATAYRCQLCEVTALSKKAFIIHCRSLSHLRHVKKQGKYASGPLEYLTFPASMSKTSVADILERTQKDPDGLGSAPNQILATADMENSRAAFDGDIEMTAMMGSPNKEGDSSMGMGIDRTAAKVPNSKMKSDSSTVVNKINKTARRSASETSKMIHKHARFINNLYYCNLCFYKTNMKGNMRVHLLGKHHMYSAKAYKCQLCGTTTLINSEFVKHCKSLRHMDMVTQKGKDHTNPLEYLVFSACMSENSPAATLKRNLELKYAGSVSDICTQTLETSDACDIYKNRDLTIVESTGSTFEKRKRITVYEYNKKEYDIHKKQKRTTTRGKNLAEISRLAVEAHEPIQDQVSTDTFEIDWRSTQDYQNTGTSYNQLDLGSTVGYQKAGKSHHQQGRNSYSVGMEIAQPFVELDPSTLDSANTNLPISQDSACQKRNSDTESEVDNHLINLDKDDSMYVNHGANDYYCKTCDTQCNNMASFKRHLTLVKHQLNFQLKQNDIIQEKPLNEINCPCNCGFTSSQKVHMDLHLADKHGAFICQLCNMITLASEQFLLHCQSQRHKDTVVAGKRLDDDPSEFLVFPKLSKGISGEKIRMQILEEHKHTPKDVELVNWRKDPHGNFLCPHCLYKSSNKPNVKRHLVCHHSYHSDDACHCTVCDVKELFLHFFLKHCDTSKHWENVKYEDKTNVDPRKYLIIPQSKCSSEVLGKLEKAKQKHCQGTASETALLLDEISLVSGSSEDENTLDFVEVSEDETDELSLKSNQTNSVRENADRNPLDECRSDESTGNGMNRALQHPKCRSVAKKSTTKGSAKMLLERKRTPSASQTKQDEGINQVGQQSPTLSQIGVRKDKERCLLGSSSPFAQQADSTSRSRSQSLVSDTSNVQGSSRSRNSSFSSTKTPTPSSSIPSSSPAPSQSANPLDGFTSDELMEALQGRDAVFSCVCGMHFTRRAHYFVHRSVHDQRQEGMCAMCQHVFDDWTEFHAHLFVHENKSSG